jgi:hypothetical protein
MCIRYHLAQSAQQESFKLHQDLQHAYLVDWAVFQREQAPPAADHATLGLIKAIQGKLLALDVVKDPLPLILEAAYVHPAQLAPTLQ